jgi:hypothetical protein
VRDKFDKMLDNMCNSYGMSEGYAHTSDKSAITAAQTAADVTILGLAEEHSAQVIREALSLGLTRRGEYVLANCATNSI